MRILALLVLSLCLPADAQYTGYGHSGPASTVLMQANNIQNSVTNWGNCGTTICAGGAGNSSALTQTTGIESPSLSGAAIAAATQVLSYRCKNVWSGAYTITGASAISNNAGSSTCNVADSSSNALLTGAITANTSWVAGVQSATTTIASGAWVTFTVVPDGVSTSINCQLVLSHN